MQFPGEYTLYLCVDDKGRYRYTQEEVIIDNCWEKVFPESTLKPERVLRVVK